MAYLNHPVWQRTQLSVILSTLKRFLLIRRVERIDQNKLVKRAMFFKVYLTNPSMWAALFGQLKPDSAAIGAMTETVIF
jgi:hypothetical protein